MTRKYSSSSSSLSLLSVFLSVYLRFSPLLFSEKGGGRGQRTPNRSRIDNGVCSYVRTCGAWPPPPPSCCKGGGGIQLQLYKQRGSKEEEEEEDERKELSDVQRTRHSFPSCRPLRRPAPAKRAIHGIQKRRRRRARLRHLRQRSKKRGEKGKCAWPRIK